MSVAAHQTNDRGRPFSGPVNGLNTLVSGTRHALDETEKSGDLDP
ncbi:hypothetical protein CCHR01_03222 [Colletotrichum chrysophilum]|uniref:Uncharacterized protein n=1 Tax=Colletotrichum chrysophilum TaxID=1836956 RepID=A0AAD9AVG4_9PEZI|nr:hypothetical protein CCHR01_03222 [Colletotrichum chrysophilum]